jgi:predicted nucleotidyltransferase
MNYMTLLDKQAAARDGLLTKLVETLPADERFVAAWLTGSFANGTADALSDLDLTVVVTENAAPGLCARP